MPAEASVGQLRGWFVRNKKIIMISKKKTKAHISVGFPAIVALLTGHVGRLKALDQWGTSCILKYKAFRDKECQGLFCREKAPGQMVEQP
jgi:hypothetical protein